MIDPAALELALLAAQRLAVAMDEFTKALPTLVEAGQVITHMKLTGAEIPSLEDILILKNSAAALDAVAQTAIDAKRAEEEGRN